MVYNSLGNSKLDHHKFDLTYRDCSCGLGSGIFLFWY